jgi:hypothetical protein
MTNIYVDKEEVLDLIEGTIMKALNDPDMAIQSQVAQKIYFQIKAIEGVEKSDITPKASRL